MNKWIRKRTRRYVFCETVALYVTEYLGVTRDELLELVFLDSQLEETCNSAIAAFVYGGHGLGWAIIASGLEDFISRWGWVR